MADWQTKLWDIFYTGWTETSSLLKKFKGLPELNWMNEWLSIHDGYDTWFYGLLLKSQHFKEIYCHEME